MSADSLQRTFEALAASSRSEADEVLVAALGSDQAKIKDLAAASICHRGSVRGMIELLRHFDELSDAARRCLVEPSEPAARAFKQALRQNDLSLIRHTLAAIRFGALIEHLPAVAELLTADPPDLARDSFDTFSVVAEHFYELLSHPTAGSRSGRLDLGRLRDETLEAIAVACSRHDALPNANAIVEHLLALGTPRHPAVVKVMRHDTAECRAFVETVLATSGHPGVMRMLFEFLSESYPPRRAFDAIRYRDDPEFIAALLRWYPDNPTAVQLANFRQVDSVCWLSSPERIGTVPDALQGRLPAFILATGLPEPHKMELQEWLLRNGSAEGRRGATQILDRLDFDTMRRILLDGLDSPDDDVSAWATTQLRPRHVPGAFKMLIDRLDSPSDAVRQAAREQLKGFAIEQVLAIHDRLPPAMCAAIGELVRKIDPDCVAKLTAMLNGPVQRQRIATAQAVARLGLAPALREPLLAMLVDDDSSVRRVAVEVMAEDPSPEVLLALEELRSDSSPRVRQAVERAIQNAALASQSSESIAVAT